VLAGAALIAALAGCGADMAGFADRADSACAKTARAIERLDITGDTSTGSTTAALRKELDRYKAMELLVSEITEGALPDGADGEAIESRWLEPARSSLESRRADLLALSHAVRDEDDERVPELAAEASKAGTDDVDDRYLAENDMPACAALFS
jgi:hypothetical protein